MKDDNTYSLLDKFTVDDMAMFIAHNHYPPFLASNFSAFKEERLSIYLNDPRYVELFNLNARYRHLDGIGLLYAHGAYPKAGINKDNWLFDDSNSLHKVQDWVNTYDGKYNLLILCCHIPEKVSIRSRKSILLLPDDAYTRSKDQQHVKSRLYVPRMGLIEVTNMNSVVDDIV